MAIERGARQAAAELLPQDAVDHHVAASRLFFLQLDCAVQQGLLPGTWAAAVAALSWESSLDSFVTQPLPPPPQRAHGDPLVLAIGQQMLFLGQTTEVRLALRLGNFSQQQRAQ